MSDDATMQRARFLSDRAVEPMNDDQREEAIVAFGEVVEHVDEAVEAYKSVLETFTADETPWIAERLDFARQGLAQMGGES